MNRWPFLHKCNHVIVSILFKQRNFVDIEYHVTVTWLNCIDIQRFIDLNRSCVGIDVNVLAHAIWYAAILGINRMRQ